MNDILGMMEEDFEKTLSSVETLDNAGLDTVAGLARKIKYQQDKVERLDRELKDEKQALLKLTDEDLPSTMADLGLSKFSLYASFSLQLTTNKTKAKIKALRIISICVFFSLKINQFCLKLAL